MIRALWTGLGMLTILLLARPGTAEGKPTGLADAALLSAADSPRTAPEDPRFTVVSTANPGRSARRTTGAGAM